MEKDFFYDDPKDWPKDITVTLDASHEDDRGFIQCLVNVPTRNISLIFSKKGSLRSNHYHKTDWHYMYILSGSMDYYYRSHGHRGEIKKAIFKKGDMIFTPPMEEHATYFPEDTHFLAISRNFRDQEAYEADVIRIQLVDPDSLVSHE
jgi:oxalate decarboxylase/phosphoglucose isomerase-like protein (cupin superfamily)